jgi:IclR family mhp operon transcriptional activator
MRTPPKPIRAFARGLDLLAALNRHGGATALTLARETGIPRPSVYRLLETLERAGYIARSLSDERWVLRLKVRSLSDGFEDEEWITTIAAPALYRLTERIGWPCDLCTLEGTSMVIRETTHRVARFSIDRGMIGRALPVLQSSVGLAWLAFAPRSERDTLLRLLAASDREEDAPARDVARVLRLITATRRRGYALRPGGSPPWTHTGSLALPVRSQGGVLGCVNAIWMARAVSTEEGVRLCLEPLRAAVAEVENALAQACDPPRSGNVDSSNNLLRDAK